MVIPYLLAPMAELSHRGLRELLEGFGGCDEYFTEMISAAALFAGGPYEQWYIDNGPCPEKLVYQIVGADIGQMVKAAAALDLRECKGIDLNMGCSAPLIRKAGAGVAWMASIDRAGELVSRVRNVVKRRLSIKIRTGLTDDCDYLVKFCRRLEAEGADLIILHPRTAKEKFKRLARWSYVGILRQELRIPIAGNGDITNAEGLIKRTEGPCDAVMVGRAAIRRPWIFAQARGIGNRDQGSGSSDCRLINDNTAVEYPGNTNSSLVQETGLRFLELLARWQPADFHLSRARRFFSYFCDNVVWGNYLKNRLNRETTLSGFEQVWCDYFTGGHYEAF